MAALANLMARGRGKKSYRSGGKIKQQPGQGLEVVTGDKRAVKLGSGVLKKTVKPPRGVDQGTGIQGANFSGNTLTGPTGTQDYGRMTSAPGGYDTIQSQGTPASQAKDISLSGTSSDRSLRSTVDVSKSRSSGFSDILRRASKVRRAR